ncbi:30S ribosomal protein S10 chloroplastic [Euphorbia peplus]|nr:30S ribosomal protein S10 chloroplastic [Euphorbia peplus]
MALSSITTTLIPYVAAASSSSSFQSKQTKLFSTCLLPNCASLKYSNSRSRVFAAPETLTSEESPLDEPDADDTFQVGEFPKNPALSIGAEADKMAPKQKIRIKLRSYWVPLIEDSCKQIMDAARTTNAKTMGPVPLPTKKRIYCVLKSPHVHKDARFHFEIRTHQRLIDILYPTAQTIDSLMQLDLPAGVDVEVKL